MLCQLSNPPPGLTDVVAAQINQVMRSPASLCVLLGWIVIAYFLEVCPDFPSKWIPPLTILGSAASYPLFAPIASVTGDAPCKVCVLIVNGLVCGFLAATLHRYVLKWLISKFLPSSNDQPPNPPNKP